MKKLLGLLSFLTIINGGLSILNNNNFKTTKLESYNNMTLQYFQQLKIERVDFTFIFFPERWGNNFVMRFSHRAVQWIRDNRRNARDIFGAISIALGVSTSFAPENMQKALGVSTGVAGLLSILFARWNENPENLTNSIINDENEDEGNGLDVLVGSSSEGHITVNIRRAKPKQPKK